MLKIALLLLGALLAVAQVFRVKRFLNFLKIMEHFLNRPIKCTFAKASRPVSPS